MNEITFLEYTFMFKPSEGWSHLYEFEKDISSFFDERGFVAEIIKVIEGGANKRVLYLKKKTPIIPDRPNPSGRPMSTKGILKGMTNRPLRKSAEEFDKKRLNLDKPMGRIK
jgi:hypothetical protein